MSNSTLVVIDDTIVNRAIAQIASRRYRKDRKVRISDFPNMKRWTFHRAMNKLINYDLVDSGHLNEDEVREYELKHAITPAAIARYIEGFVIKN